MSSAIISLLPRGDRRVVLWMVLAHFGLWLLAWQNLKVAPTRVAEFVLEVEQIPRSAVSGSFKSVVPSSNTASASARALAPANSVKPESELGGVKTLAQPGTTAPVVSSPSSEATKTTTSSLEKSAPSASGGAAIPNNDVDYKAGYLHNPKPPYPPMAFKLHLQGEVLVRVEVAEDGSPGRVSLARSSGHLSLDEAVLATVPKWRFRPAHHDGSAVRQTVLIPISFNLVKPSGAEAQ
jgi:protein TonB